MGSSFKEVEVLANLNNGAIEELFAPELQKVLNNMGDSNTSFKSAREINIKIKFRLTNESRENAVSEISVSSKIAQPKAHESNIYLENTGHGVLALFKEPEVQPELENVTEFKKSEEA
jgi:hypothetical protein